MVGRSGDFRAPIARADAEDEVVELCSDLIRIDTLQPDQSNERAAAEYVAGKLAEVGIEPTRAGVGAGPGQRGRPDRGRPTRSRPALLVHGHLDVVPADPAEWSVHPFSGEVRDGYVWGRGAVDMKDMDAMTLALVREWARTGQRPPRDIVLAFVADEEAGGVHGARWLVDDHPDLFEGCTEAISEVGGFSVTVRDDLRLYLVQTAEKGMAWLRLVARGRAGARLDAARRQRGDPAGRGGGPGRAAPVPAGADPDGAAVPGGAVRGVEVDLDLEIADREELEALIARLGSLARMVGATLRNTANPTRCSTPATRPTSSPARPARPSTGASCPGRRRSSSGSWTSWSGPGVVREWVHHDQAVETDFDGPLVDAMAAALRAEDPARAAGAVHDARRHGREVLRAAGHALLRVLPAAAAGRTWTSRRCSTASTSGCPIEALRFGVRVLDRFLASS